MRNHDSTQYVYNQDPLYYTESSRLECKLVWWTRGAQYSLSSLL